MARGENMQNITSAISLCLNLPQSYHHGVPQVIGFSLTFDLTSLATSCMCWHVRCRDVHVFCQTNEIMKQMWYQFCILVYYSAASLYNRFVTVTLQAVQSLGQRLGLGLRLEFKVRVTRLCVLCNVISLKAALVKS